MSKAQELCADGTPIDLSVSDQLRKGGLAHISKSRVKTYLQCPRLFYYKYWCENRTPGSYHTEKGTEIHRAYEDFHLNLIEYVEETGARPEWYTDVMGHWGDYHQWLDPHIANFWKFEDERWELSQEAAFREYNEEHDTDREEHNKITYARALKLWLPIGVEVEGRLDDPPVGDLPWMGYADAVLHAATVPGVEKDEGVVIVDYKTGKVQDEKYRDKGIYLEGEFYGWLFENDLEEEVVAVAGYYPQEDELVLSPYPDQDRRNTIMRAVVSMQQPPEIENYPIDEGPLCHYGHGRCFFYDECPSRWGMADGPGWHSKAEPDGGIKPKDD